ncbi:MAG: squalene/phytoene synthase family protein [Pseudomonadota bacterium]
MDNYYYCAEKATPTGSPEYYMTLYLPLSVKRRWIAWRALQHELFNIARRVSESAVALQKLGWWQGEIMHLCEGKPLHPITKLLHESLPNGLEYKQFESLLIRLEEDITHFEFPTEHNFQLEALTRYRLSIESTFDLPEVSLIHLCSSMHFFDVLQHLQTDQSLGLCMLPVDKIASIGLQYDQLLEENNRVKFSHFLEEYNRMLRTDALSNIQGISASAMFYWKCLHKVAASQINCNLTKQPSNQRQKKDLFYLSPLYLLWLAFSSRF